MLDGCKSLTLGGKAVKRVAIGGATVWEAGGAEYEELTYIKSSGTQWIDTGVNATSVRKVVLETMMNYGGGAQYQGIQENTNKRLFAGRSANKLNASIGNSEQETVIGSILKDGWHRYTLDVTGKAFAFEALDADGTPTPSVSNSNPSGTFSNNTMPNGNFYLFARNRVGSIDCYVKGNVYNCKFWCSEGDEPTHHFVAARRIADGTLGMYDKVSGRFFENLGDRDKPFTAGEPTGVYY